MGRRSDEGEAGDHAYTFGDGDEAARRLGQVAELFDPPTRAFLERLRPRIGEPATVVDLGCGPGHTTRLLAEVLRPVRLVALETSDDFARRARQLVPAAEVHDHDVTRPPLPGAPAEVVFARLVLAHLPDAAAVARSWVTQLRPGGHLLLDEIDAIETDVAVLADYLATVTELVASRGATMAAGPDLDGFASEAAGEGRVLRDDHVAHPVDPAAAAAMFRRNLRVWRDDPAVERHRRSGLLDRLDRGLADVAAGASPGGRVTWHLRQLAVRAPAVGRGRGSAGSPTGSNSCGPGAPGP